jgi:hypothetical protein
MVESDTTYGDNVQKWCQDKWHVSHMATCVKYGDTQEETIGRVKSVAECGVATLRQSVGEGG